MIFTVVKIKFNIMRKKNLLLATFCFLFFMLEINVLAQTKQRPGIPERSPCLHVWEKFVSPPDGYGEVPFYWWLGDTLTREHLTWHLDLLAKKKISSLQINYAHSDKGGPFWGLTIPSKPDIFTDDWWNLFNWFKEEAVKRNMTVSLSDYTLGVGQGSYVDKALTSYPELVSRELKFECKKFKGHVTMPVGENVVSIVAYHKEMTLDLTHKVRDAHLSTILPEGEWDIYLCTWHKKEISFDAMNPLAGKAYNDNFFQQFENRSSDKSSKGLNFFFSDELNFNQGKYPWNDIFSSEFKQRKGYEIEPYLPALIRNIGPMTAKVRLDYNDVYVSLSEEYFFKPVYEWHQKRGMIIGCDHGGRGRDVREFGDYFRTQRWNQAPGSDQPRLGKDIIKSKVASSIAHLYERPRVWLEGFYSSGWGTNTEQLLDAIYANFLMGYNLLSLHGLYYSTPGGWWEWAPPCNHFRMPYWEQMGALLEMTERLSYLFSQGYHVADVAILYPVEPVVAGYGDRAPSAAFDAARTFYANGIDFDFMDYESLARAKVDNATLRLSGENYRMIIVPEMKAIRYSSLEKLVEFKRAGGIVVIMGDTPQVTDKYPDGDIRLCRLVDALMETNDNSNFFHVEGKSDELVEIFDSCLVRDFKLLTPLPFSSQPYIMHRTIGERELYAVYGVPAGSDCFFRSKGAIELWNPWEATRTPIAVKSVTADGMVVNMPLAKNELSIFMIDKSGQPLLDEIRHPKQQKKIASLDGEWEFELRPVLDNRYGDFLWPATNEFMSAYVYDARYSAIPIGYENDWVQSSYDDSLWEKQTFSYGKRFYIIDGVDLIKEEELQKNIPSLHFIDKNQFGLYGNIKVWMPYEFSWRWGVRNDYGHQGYHGLKLEINDDFIRLGNLQGSLPELKRIAKPKNNYYLFTRITAPHKGEYKVDMGKLKPSRLYVNGYSQGLQENKIFLDKGVNTLMIHYNTHGTTYFVVRNQTGTVILSDYYQKEAPLKTSFRGDTSILPFDLYANEGRFFNCFRFKSAPALNKLKFASYGNARVWVDGVECRVSSLGNQVDGLINYEAVVNKPSARESIVAISVENVPGMNGGAAIDGGIRQECGNRGLLNIGDWGKMEGLRAYSGSAWYRKTISLSISEEKRIILDLGRVVSTAEVYVNGEKVALKMHSPWRFDISRYVKSGDNRVEVLVHNTAGNHYLSIPTQYRGSTEAGIIGEVSILQE